MNCLQGSDVPRTRPVGKKVERDAYIAEVVLPGPCSQLCRQKVTQPISVSDTRVPSIGHGAIAHGIRCTSGIYPRNILLGYRKLPSNSVSISGRDVLNSVASNSVSQFASNFGFDCDEFVSDDGAMRTPGGQRQTDHYVSSAEPSLETCASACNGNICNVGGQQQNNLIANPSADLPARQIWHVGVARGSLNLKQVEDFPVLRKTLLRCEGAQREIGHKFKVRNIKRSRPNVLLVRGCHFDRTHENEGVLKSLISSWLHGNQVVVVYVKGRCGVLQDNIKHTFKTVGSSGNWFPVCSCLSEPRVHCKGLVLTNVPELGTQFTECNAQATGIRDQSWHNWVSDSIIKRIIRVFPSCNISKRQRHFHNQELWFGV